MKLDDFPSTTKIEPDYTFDDPDFFKEPFCNIIHGDCIEGIKKLPDFCLDSVITSPPYYRLRSYGVEGEIGQENDPRDYISKLVDMCKVLKYKLKSGGTLFVNLGDSYFGRNYGGGPSSREREKGKRWDDKSKKYTSSPYKDVVDLPWLKRKQLMMMPARFAIAMQDDGWILRNKITWLKSSSQPFSGKDRLANAYEEIFFFVKSPKYYFDLDSIRVSRAKSSIIRAYAKNWLEKRKAKGNEPSAISGKSMDKACEKLREQYDVYFKTHKVRGKFKTEDQVVEACLKVGLDPDDVCPMCGRTFRRHGGKFCHPKGVNPTDVAYKWFRDREDEVGVTDIIYCSNTGYKGAHFAVFNTELIKPLILAGSPEGGTILDPFCGSGTTLLIAMELNRNAVGIELNKEYIPMAQKRLSEAKYDVRVYEV